MPVLKKLVISDFRNIEFQEISFSPNVNCICGDNGEGKTNLLDAIYYMSMTRSSFSNSDRYIFRHGKDSFSLCGVYGMADRPDTKFALRASASGEKKLKRDDKPCERLSGHIGILPIVMVSPSDTSLVNEASEERRKFVNSVISQMDREYLSAAQQYNRQLMQRNRILKEENPDRELLKVIGGMMGTAAQRIYDQRLQFARDLVPVIKEFYSSLSGGKEEVGVEYKSDLQSGSLEEILSSCMEKDIFLGYTTAGIHRDDFEFTIDGHPLRRCGSQGQQKSFLVSLKFAQYEIMKSRYGFAPILLLDDVFDKLDMTRITNLLSMVAGKDFGQIFITDSNKVRLKGMVDRLTTDRSYFEASGGCFTRIADPGIAEA